MGRKTSTVDWPVRFLVEDGRVFVVSKADDGQLCIQVDGTSGRYPMGLGTGSYTPSVGAVVGRALTWWYRNTGEAILLATRPP